MNFSAKNPALRKSQNRYSKRKTLLNTNPCLHSLYIETQIAKQKKRYPTSFPFLASTNPQNTIQKS